MIWAFGRSQIAWRLLSVSSAVDFFPSVSFSTSMTIGCSMKSEYCFTIVRSRHSSRNSLASSRRWRITSVPRDERSAGSTVYSPWPSDSHFTPSASPAMREMTVTRSAAMKDE